MTGGLVLAVLAGLLLTSTPRAIGDGDEYLVTGRKLADFQWPSFSQSDVDRLHPGLKWVPTRNGAFEVPHFWMYPLLAAPAIKVADMLGLSVAWAFAALNVALFACVAAVALRRAWPGAAVLVLLSPIVWWLDKAHTETFTFSLLALTILLVRDRPGVAMACIGLAATQNPPIAALLPLVLLLYPAARSRWVWIAVALLLAALHPAYYLWTIGKTTALIEGDIRIPPLMRYGAVLWDLNIGLLSNAPFFALACGIGLVAARQGWTSRWRDATLAAVAGAWFLFSFTQAVNINHGGTPSMSRYALWLLPLAFPVLPHAGDRLGPRVSWAMGAAVAVSVFWSVLFFYPQRPEGHLQPTPLAHWQWTRFPGWQNPVPEIFAERLRGRDAVNELAATPGCEKVLIQAGVWPEPCPPQPTPPRCRQPDASCYANRADGRYEFVQVPRRGGYTIAWPPERGR
jgi:hypothetical protein